jgi:hypothetical protein
MLTARKFRRQKPRRGVLTLEWILIITVLVIGIVGGVAVVRNAIVSEMYDMSESIMDLQVKTDAECIAETGVVCP